MELESHTCLFVHLIFCTRARKAMLRKPLRKVLFGFWQGWSERNLIKIISINGVDDHVHCLIQLHPTWSLNHVMNLMKEDAAQWINENKIIPEHFDWDPGNFAYSVSPGSLKQVAEYINNQELHHQDKSPGGNWNHLKRSGYNPLTRS